MSTAGQQGISVIVPAYNCEETLGATLDSLLAQTYGDWEAIVVDDGSADGTAEVAESYSRRDERVRLHRQGNKGVGGARNAGIELARRPWMFFLDADDTIVPEAFEELVAATVADPRTDAVLAGCRRVDADGRTLRSQLPGHHEDHFAVFARICAIVIHSCLVRTELVRRVGGFDESLVTCEDWDLWQRIARMGARFTTIPVDVAIYRMRPGTASHDGRRMLRDGLLVIDRGHGVDERMTGLEAEDLKLPPLQARNVARTYLTCYAAGLEMASGRDARWMVEALGSGISGSVDPEGVAETLCLALADGLVASPGEWTKFPPEAHDRCREFATALGDRLGDHWLAFGAQNALERMALRGERGREPARAGRWQLVEVDASRPLEGGIEFAEGAELGLIVVRFGEDEIGDVEVSLPDGALDRRIVADAVAAHLAWDLLERFLAREVVPRLEISEAGGSTRVLRDGRLLFEGELNGDRPRHLALHDEIGWTLFLQELFGVRSLVGEEFYAPEPEDEEEVGEAREVGGGLVEIDVAEPLPALRPREGDSVDVAVRVGGSPLTAICCPARRGVLSVHRLRREILVQCGFELCRAVLREALLLAPTDATGSLSDRLRATLRERRAGGRLVPAGATAIGRGEGRDGTSASRWLALPRAAAKDRLELARRDGDPVTDPDAGGPLLSAPLVLDRVRTPAGGLSDASIWRSLDFERIFGREVDPWCLQAPYEADKYRLTLAMVPGRVGSALELGCAEGHFTEQLAGKVRRLTAADLSFIALSRARKRCGRRRNVEFARLDAFDGDLGGPYDLVVCSELLYYAGTGEALERGIRGIARGLRGGGHLLTAHAHALVDDPAAPGFDWDVPFGAAGLDRAFRESGMFDLREEVRTDAYRIQLWRRKDGRRRRRREPRVRRVPAVAPEGMPQFRPEGGEVRRQPAQKPAGAKSFPILMYHRVAPEGAEATARWRLHPEAFEEQLSHLREHGYTSIDFEQWRVASDRRYPIPPSSVMITFDDGYADFVDYAQPLLAKYDFQATVFVVSDLVGGSNRWDEALGEELELMSWSQLRGLLRAGVQIGSHSSGHRPLVSLSATELAEDLCASRLRFHEELGFPVRSVSYPFGLHDASVRSVAAACGFQYGVTTDEWHAAFGGDLLMLPRIEVRGTEGFDEFKANLRG